MNGTLAAASNRVVVTAFGMLVVLASSACTMTQPTLQETRELELNVEPNSRFSIDAGSGSLTLQGEAGSDAIRVIAEIYQVEPNDNYRLSLDALGDGSSELIAVTGDRRSPGNDAIALSIRVPESLEISIRDGSGSMNVSDLAADLAVDDGSGSMRIENIGGNVVIDDGSGSIRVEEIGGDLTIEDGSGSITARNISGTVSVDDGSGSINVDGAADFELIDDGSGSIDLDNIASRN